MVYVLDTYSQIWLTRWAQGSPSCNPGLIFSREVHANVGETHWLHCSWDINMYVAIIKRENELTIHIIIQWNMNYYGKYLLVNVRGVSSFSRATSLSFVFMSYPSWLMILLTLLPELNLNKLTSPEYTIHTAGLEYLSWGKTVKHREHKAQGLFVFFPECLSQDRKTNMYKQGKWHEGPQSDSELTFGSSVQQIGSSKGW